MPQHSPARPRVANSDKELVSPRNWANRQQQTHKSALVVVQRSWMLVALNHVATTLLMIGAMKSV